MKSFIEVVGEPFEANYNRENNWGFFYWFGVGKSTLQVKGKRMFAKAVEICDTDMFDPENTYLRFSAENLVHTPTNETVALHVMSMETKREIYTVQHRGKFNDNPTWEVIKHDSKGFTRTILSSKDWEDVVEFFKA